MKTLKYFVGLVIICAALLFAESEKTYAPVSDVYRPTQTVDTITNTESDTITIPAQFLDGWIPVVKFETTQLSGTQNLSFTFQESHSLTVSDWMTTGSAVTTSGSTDSDIFRYASATTPVQSGLRSRIIITGTGTQSTRYVIRYVAKRAK
jgi:hypothetical protein